MRPSNLKSCVLLSVMALVLSACGGSGAGTTSTPAPTTAQSETPIATQSGDAVTIAWSKVSGAAMYELSRSTDADSGFRAIYSGSESSYNDTALVAGKTYYYRFRYCTDKVDTGSCSADSSASRVVTNPVAPGVPTARAQSDTRIGVSWVAVSGAKLYRLYRATSEDGDFELINTGSALRYDDTELSASTAYYYTISACGDRSDSSCSVQSSPGDATTSDVDTSALAAPSNLTLTYSPVKQFAFSWSYSNTSGVSYYKLLEDPDSISGFTEVARIASATSTHYALPVTLYKRLNARYYLIACNTDLCSTESNQVNIDQASLTAAIGYFKASNTEAYDRFGHAVSLSNDGTVLAIGAAHESSNAIGINGDQSSNSATASGAVYLFAKTADSWTQTAYIKASNTDAKDRFGFVVNLSADGRTLAVGAHGEDSNATGTNEHQSDNSASNSGAVYMFEQQTGGWTQTTYVKASNSQAGDKFGFSLHLSGNGNALAVGARGEDSTATGFNGDQGSNSATASGAVYLFEKHSGHWAQTDYIKAGDTHAGDQFGQAVALSTDGSTLAVSAIGRGYAKGHYGKQTSDKKSDHYNDHNDRGVRNDDHTHDYSDDHSGDYYDDRHDDHDDHSDDHSGHYGDHSSGDQGGYFNRSPKRSSAVYLFEKNTGSWTQTAHIKASDIDAGGKFGRAMSLSADGSTLAVGAKARGYARGSYDDKWASKSYRHFAKASDVVYVFEKSAGAWTKTAAVKSNRTDVSGKFGQTVSLSADGTTLAIGAKARGYARGIYGSDRAAKRFYGHFAKRSGGVYVFEKQVGTWSQVAYINARNTKDHDAFGSAVSLSADGSALAIGSYAESSSATGIGGSQGDNAARGSGAVYLY